MAIDTVPHYTTDAEIRAARSMHGATYDRLIAKGAIVAPTREELSDADLAERLVKVDTKNEGKKARKSSRKKSARKSVRKSARKRSAKKHEAE